MTTPKPAEGAKPIGRNPTEAMASAGLAAIDDLRETCPDFLLAIEIFRAMWDAAPSPEGVGPYRWRSIAQMPPEDEDVLLFFGTHVAADVGLWNGRCWQRSGDSMNDYDTEPTHWALIPQPYPAVGQDGPSEPEGGG